MPMRLSGLMSGMDTESIISQLVEARKTKVTKAVKAQKSLKYKQDAWKDLNKQILNLYNKSLSNMRFESSFIKKTTKVSNSSVVSVITGDGAMNSVQSLKVDKMAQSGYLTGGKLELVTDADGNPAKAGDAVTGKTKLSQLGFDIPEGEKASIKVKIGNEVTNITVDGNSTVENFVKTLRDAGVSANFDEVNGRIHVAAKASGKDNDFEIMGMNLQGTKALKALKLSYVSEGMEEAYASMFENKNDTIAARQNSRLRDIVSLRSNSMANCENILKGMDSEYIAKINDKLSENGIPLQLDENTDYSALDEDDWNEINKAVNTVFDAASADILTNTDVEAAEATRAALGGWVGNQTNIESAERQLAKNDDGTLKTDADGNFMLSADTAATIAQTVEDEVQNAMNAWNELKNGAGENSAKKSDAQNAEVYLNGVLYEPDKNTFEVNGLTFTINSTTAPGETVTVTTQDDTDGIYDMVKNFFKEYNSLINQMDKLYNADSAKGYDPLTDEEKDAMSDSAIEEWESKIKDSILRKDSTLGTFSQAMKQIMMEGVEVNGKKMYLSNFGINTLNYFTAADNEKNAYHIDGDPDDENTSGNTDKLKSMIANDPDTVVAFFTQLSKNLYNKMFDMMKADEAGYSSAMTAYEDKKMQKEYDDYTTKIKDLEKKLADYEDKWYAKFAAMETALAKMQSNASAVTALLGGS